MGNEGARAILVAGASRGVGRALALALARSKTPVVIAARSAPELEQLGAQIRGLGVEAREVAGDLGRADTAARCVEAGATLGGLSAAIYAAGVSPPRAPLWAADEADIETALLTNLAGPIWCSRAFIEAVGQGIGRLIFVSSGLAGAPWPGAAAYVATKAGLEGLVRALALDLEGSGISATALRLGGLRTEMTRALMSADDWAALPPPEAAVPPILRLLDADAGLIHGRIFAADRLERDADAELALASPLSALRPLRTDAALWRGPGVLALDRLENPCGASPAARGALERLARAPDLHRYPEEGHPTLRRALAARAGVPASAVGLGAGASALLERALQVFVAPGESAVCADPTWEHFERLCAARGARLRRVPVEVQAAPLGRLARRHVARLDLDRVLEAVDASTRLIYLVNPAWPTGASLPDPDLLAFLAQVPRRVAVVLDACYEGYAATPRPPRSLIAAHQGPAPLIALHTFSKRFGLAGLRVGYTLATPGAAGLLARLESPYELSTVAAAAALAALGDDAHARHAAEVVSRSRRALVEGLDALGIDWIDSEASFVLARTPDLADRCAEASILIPRGVYLGGFAVAPVGLPEHTRRLLALLGA